jgi:hypothetical protein
LKVLLRMAHQGACRFGALLPTALGSRSSAKIPDRLITPLTATP